MKLWAIATLMTLAVFGAGACALGRTVTASIATSAQIVPGTTVSVFLRDGGPVTVVRSAGSAGASAAGAITTISFEHDRSWYFVKRVAWDKAHRRLTIDF